MKDPNATTRDDVFSLPEGEHRLQAQRTAYVDRLASVDARLLGVFAQKAERLVKAEHLFVGEAFDDVVAAVEGSALSDDEKAYFFEQFMAFPPVYRACEVAVAQISVEPILMAAMKNDQALMRAVLTADSRARVMSAEISSSDASLGLFYGSMVLLHALIARGVDVNGKPIDFSAVPITVTMAVDEENMTLDEKTILADVQDGVLLAEANLEQKRSEAMSPMDAFREAMVGAKDQAEAKLAQAKAEALGVVNAHHEALLQQKQEADDQFAQAVAAFKATITAYQAEHDDVDMSAIINAGDYLNDLSSRTSRVMDQLRRKGLDQPVEAAIALLLDAHRAHNAAYAGNDARMINIFDALRKVLEGDNGVVNSDPIVQHCRRELRRSISVFDVQEGEDFRSVADFIISCTERSKVRDVVQKVDEVKAAFVALRSAKEGVHYGSESLEQLRFAVNGDQKQYDKRGDGRVGPDLSTAEGFSDARVRCEIGVKRYGYAVDLHDFVNAVLDADKEVEKALAGLQAAKKSASVERDNVDRELDKGRHAVFANAVRAGVAPKTLQELQLLREIAVSESAAGSSVNKAAFTLRTRPQDGRDQFFITEFGAVDAEGNLQCPGVEPGEASVLRQKLAAHLDDYDIRGDRPPLSVTEVVDAARSAIGGANAKTAKAKGAFTELRGDYGQLGGQALDLAESENVLFEQNAELTEALARGRDEFDAARVAHQEDVAARVSELADLRVQKDAESNRANIAEAKVAAILAAISTFKADMSAADAKTFGSASARKKASDDLDAVLRKLNG